MICHSFWILRRREHLQSRLDPWSPQSKEVSPQFSPRDGRHAHGLACLTLWLSHPAISLWVVLFVWVGAAVSPAVAGDAVVCRLHSEAEIVIRVKGRDVTIRLLFFRCKQTAFYVWCFWMWVLTWRRNAFLSGTAVSYLPLSLLSHDFSSPHGWSCHSVPIICSLGSFLLIQTIHLPLPQVLQTF